MIVATVNLIMKELIQLEGDKIVRKIPLTQEQYSLGRDTENDIVFDTSKVSRVHAFLIKEGDVYAIIDHNSKNRVLVNGDQVTRKQLVSGDRINLSQDVALLYLAEEPAGTQFAHVLSRVWDIIEKRDLLQLKEVTSRIISLDNLDQILDVILDEAIRSVNAERGLIAVVDAAGEIEDSPVMSGLFEDVDLSSFPPSVVQEAVAKRQNIFLNVRTDENGRANILQDSNQESVMCAPLMFGDSLVGILYVDTRQCLFDELDQLFFTIYCDYAAVAIENAKLFSRIETSNQQLRAEMEESETRYRQLVEYSPEGIAVHKDGKILYVNSAAVDLLGAKTPEDLVGTPVLDRVHPNYQEIVAERVRKENAGQTVPPLEERFLRLDGSVVDVEVVGVPFVYEGKPASMALFRDISRRKRMEQELLRAQKLESVGVLAGGIAHDFNNILQVIRGNALMAKANMDDKDNVEFCLTAIEKAVLHAVSLTSQLLTFSKGGTPVTKATSIQELIEESVAFALRGSNVAYTMDFADDLYFVEVDSEQINQVIHNLVLNADQAMPDGGTVSISARNTTATKARSIHPNLKKGDYVKIAISDHGVGMPEDMLQKIFDPYFTTKQDGSGLGLASCYSIVTKHGGFIEAESTPNKGSTFTLYLPASRKQPEKHETGEWSYKLDTKVLLMDDDSMVRDTAGRMLQRLGCEVDLAVDGKQAIKEYLKAQELNEPFDIVIFDLTVPGGMGGQEALEELLTHDPDVRAIVASGYSHDPVMAAPHKYGFKGVISKPFDIKTLVKTILQVQGYNL
jgi:PAS domain S-box-containing protein